jgi:addiction module HigA family antidote
MLPTHRSPTPPGEVLAEEFLAPLGVTQAELAERMGVPLQRINLLVNGRRGITAETALLLGQVFGTTPQFWMHLQAQQELWEASQLLKKEHRSASPIKRAPKES